MTLTDIAILTSSGIAIGLCLALAYLFYAGYWRGIAVLNKLHAETNVQVCRVQEIDGTVYAIDGDGIPHKLCKDPSPCTTTTISDTGGSTFILPAPGRENGQPVVVPNPDDVWLYVNNPFPHHRADRYYFACLAPVYEKDGNPGDITQYEPAYFTDDVLIEARLRAKRIQERIDESHNA